MAGREIRVKVSQYRVARAPAVLKIFGLGSCVALALYDPVAAVGGLAHILLPGPRPDNEKSNPQAGNNYKYADQAVNALLEEMEKQGAKLHRLRAAVVGGANMFVTPDIEEKDMPGRPGIGKRNVESVKNLLQEFKVPVFGEDVGGSNGRTVIFDPGSGRVQISNYKGERKVLEPEQSGPGSRMAAE